MNMIKTEYGKTSIVTKKFLIQENDEEDPIQNFNRRTCWIKTKYGKSMPVVQVRQKILFLLMVHGSGAEKLELKLELACIRYVKK